MSVALSARPRLRLHHRRLRLDRQPRQLRRRARRPRRAALGGLHPERPRAGQDRPDRGVRPDAGRGRRHLRRREPAVQRDRRDTRTGRSSTSTSGPYYAEGSKTLGYEVAEQLGWRLPQQVVVPMASGSLLTKVDKAFGELAQARPRRGHARTRSTARRPPAARRSRRRSRTAGTPSSRSSRRRSPVARDRQPGGRPVRPGRRAPHRRRDGARQRRAGRGGHPAAGRDRGRVRRDRRRGHRRDAARS